MSRPLKRFSPMAIVLAVHLWFPWSVSADEVKLKNGDRLSGSVRSLSGGRLLFATSYAGDLSIPWGEVASLRTDHPLAAFLENGERVVVWMEPSKSGRLLLLSEVWKMSVPVSAIQAIEAPSPEEAVFLEGAVKPPRWESQAEAGVQVRSGNVDSQDFNIGLQTTRKAEGSELNAKVTAAYGETEGERTVGQVLGEGRLDLLHTERVFSFYLLNLEHDSLQDLNLRAQEDVGVGYRFIRTLRSLLQGEVGIGLTEGFFEGGDSELELNARLGARWTQQVGERSELGASLVFLPDLADLGEYRFRGESSFTTPLTDRFLLRLGLLNRFDSDPQPGIKKNDLTFRSSIVWSF